ncbi:MAG: hypothetical protein A2Z14_05730 [Chloroflexi bacterium RBG_16_48_8]|nr:MAG: hypothetical protein A2Z14_05730 [Chloroflexi bacterium RBG_16_48_8]
MDKELTLHRNQQQDFFPVATSSFPMENGRLHGDSEKTFGDDTFDEWRSSFTTVLLISMICGKFFALALRQQEVKRCV